MVGLLAGVRLVCADVVTGPGVVFISPPPSIQLNQLQSNTDIFLFQEKTGFVLPVNVHVDAATPGIYFFPTPGGTVPAGTRLNSYLVHDDPITLRVFLNRVITFTKGETILGLEMLSKTLDASDPLLEAAATNYPPPPVHWGLELGLEPEGIIWTGQTIIWNTVTGGGRDTGGEDNIRILTKVTTPEPHYFWAIALGLAVLPALKRRR